MRKISRGTKNYLWGIEINVKTMTTKTILPTYLCYPISFYNLFTGIPNLDYALYSNPYISLVMYNLVLMDLAKYLSIHTTHLDGTTLEHNI